jgi:CubicO group peptidase (beta-lactamase class C family)
MSRSLCACLLMVVSLLSALCRGQDAVATKVDDFVREEMVRQHIPGVSLLVKKDDKVVLIKGYGLANVELEVPIKPETVFQSGSVGKQFTATAVMMLVEQGKIGLEDKVTKYLTNAPPSWADIKVRHLLTHTSGLGDYPSDFDLRQDYTEDELLTKITTTPLAFKPGEKWSYSNLGYVTLGILIGKVTGKFYGDLVQERIFKPLGMTTARIISEADVVTNRAAGYRLVKGELKNQDWVSPSMNTTADGSLYLTVYDLAKWDAALSTEKLLNRSSLDQMWTPVTLNNGKTHPYGFGWFVVDVGGHRLIHHGGSWQGFHCDIQRYVDDKLTVVGFDNLAQSDLEKIIRGVAAIYNPDLKPVAAKAP